MWIEPITQLQYWTPALTKQATRSYGDYTPLRNIMYLFCPVGGLFAIPHIFQPCSQRVRFMGTYPKCTHYLVSKMILTREMDGRICIAVHVLSFAQINH